MFNILKKNANFVRTYRDGTVDDVAIDGDLYRLEQMSDHAFWTCIYRGENRVCFWIEWDYDKHCLVCTKIEDSIGTYNDSARDREPGGKDFSSWHLP